MAEFTDIVRERAGLESSADAADTAEVVLHTIAESVSHGECADLAEPLDERFERALLEPEKARAEPPSYDEFLARIADRLDVDPHEARNRARAVVAALTAVVGRDEVEDARAQLPPAYEELFAPGEALAESSFADAVVENGGFESRRQALRVAEVTLDTLGERLSKGEAEDVAEYLPSEAAEWLVPDTPARALDYSFDELVAEVADRENVPEDRAVEHVEAVTDVLAEVVGEEELSNMEAQLPETYEPLFETAA